MIADAALRQVTINGGRAAAADLRWAICPFTKAEFLRNATAGRWPGRRP